MAYSYRCPNCAANLLFDPDAKRMTCGFCDAKISPHDFLSKDGKDGFFVGEQWEAADTYNCSNCGADFIVGDSAITSRCAYCDSEAIISSRLSSGAKPAYIIPFRYGKDKAKESFLTWCQGKKLLPRKFTSHSIVESIKGIYIPVFLYDYPVDVEVSMEISSVDEHEQEESNKAIYFERNKSGFLFWRRMPIDASNRIDQELMSRIEPYNYDYIQRFEAKYMSGFLAERPEIDRRKLDLAAKERIEDYVRDAVLDSISKEDRIVSFRDESRYHLPVAEYALLPVWFLKYKYMGKDYKFVLNGQTGEVAGEAPVSVIKFGLISLLCSAGVMGLLHIIGMIWRWYLLWSIV